MKLHYLLPRRMAGENRTGRVQESRLRGPRHCGQRGGEGRGGSRAHSAAKTRRERSRARSEGELYADLDLADRKRPADQAEPRAVGIVAVGAAPAAACAPAPVPAGPTGSRRRRSRPPRSLRCSSRSGLTNDDVVPLGLVGPLAVFATVAAGSDQPETGCPSPLGRCLNSASLLRCPGRGTWLMVRALPFGPEPAPPQASRVTSAV